MRDSSEQTEILSIVSNNSRCCPLSNVKVTILFFLIMLVGCSAGDVNIADNSTRKKDVHQTVGNVFVGENCRIEGDIEVTAGNVIIAPNSIVTGRISVDHGNVELGEGVQIAAVNVKNGAIMIGPTAEIAGPVTLTNGLLEIMGARVDGLVKMKRGRLEVGTGSLVTGGLEVENLGHTLQDSSYVVIDPGARVSGQVTTRGNVRLLVSSEAEVFTVNFVGNDPEFVN